ncbi:uncharacterized protein Nmag_3398 [Natrialba magadii ATCC 43099]|uniref:Uncharacterized protein n=1 Tax=Natrialba magadii (strain ATCC 43099 / DSM 3394 / CCM 3739 / CIP 104546 / IAM 13178 / JCM 8861 / NBRC 102185 / NCIMB 2190 / MS3) TaxID=547559 RepID=D3ST81_NATMM|nr:uncharacterized protein Nmag_3398 [Natrialba magadii ATCC 43099]ELY28428.1 hypothetical protein C500_13237 [Natrialba magadii ATCC 43099]
MTTRQRDLIDQIGRVLVVAVLVYVTSFAIAYLVAMFQMSIHPLLLLFLSIAIVAGGLGTYYYRHSEKSFL